MSGFDLQDFLDQQLEHNILNQPARLDHFQDVDVAGFGFPHYRNLVEAPIRENTREEFA